MPEVTYITTSQIAERFGVSSSAVRKWVKLRKILPAVTTPGGHHRFRIEDVEALLTTEASA